MISDKTKGLITLAYLIIGSVFLCFGDAFNINWYAVFFGNEHILGALLLFIIRDTMKDAGWRKIIEVGIVWKVFYIVFNIAILFEPFSSYRDFTSNPVICTQILWLIVGFSIFQRFNHE